MSSVKIHSKNLLGADSKKSRVAKTIAVVATAISVFIVVISTFVASGFRNEIERKTVELMDFVRIKDMSQVFVNSRDISLDSVQISQINTIIAPQKLDAVIEAQGVIQNGMNMLPSILKYESSDSIARGEIVLSKSAAVSLDVKIGDYVDILSLDDDKPKRSQMKVSDIYSMGISDLEIGVARASYEDVRAMTSIEDGVVNYYAVREVTPLEPLFNYAEGEGLDVETIDYRAPQIYGWLMMIDNNLTLVLIIMVVVAIINIVTSTLIVMLDSTKIVAVLRALGMNRTAIAKIFLVGVGRYAFRGMAIGLVVGFIVGGAQSVFNIITLDEAAYYVNKVPISFEVLQIAGYMAMMGAAVVLSLLVPINIVSRLNISKALKYQ